MNRETIPIRMLCAQGGERVFHVSHGARLGRAPDNEIVVEEDGISRHHCEFEIVEDSLVVKDLGSTNGVFLNGRRVASERVRPGDQLLIGRVTFSVGGTARDEQPTIARDVGGETIEIVLTPSTSQYRADGFDRTQAEAHLAALAKFLDVVPRARSLDEILPHAVSSVVEALRFQYGAVFIGTAEDVPAYVHTLPTSAPRLPSRTILHRVFQSGEAVLATGDRSDPTLEAAKSLVAQPRTAIVCAPVSCGGSVEGALYFAGRDAQATGDRELRLVNLFARTLALAIDSLRQTERVVAENAMHRGRISGARTLLSRSENMVKLLSLAERAARTDSTVLITGETGTGKELLARAVQEWSPRQKGPFVAINCGAIPSSMIESELFGHEKGAFTGAVERRLGRFELADSGTLFLDEIGELSLEAQVKLLRVLEDRKFFRVGGSKEIKVDVRVIAATHRNLEECVRDGRFRADLLYRIRVLELALPPLRERLDDLPVLAERLLEEIDAGARRGRMSLTSEALSRMKRYPWPGNVRELRNVLERAAILTSGHRIEAEDLMLPAEVRSQMAQTAPVAGRAPLGSLEDLEKEHIAKVLDATEWNKVRAAEILGIGRTNLYEKIRLFGLKPPD